MLSFIFFKENTILHILCNLLIPRIWRQAAPQVLEMDDEAVRPHRSCGQTGRANPCGHRQPRGLREAQQSVEGPAAEKGVQFNQGTPRQLDRQLLWEARRHHSGVSPAPVTVRLKHFVKLIMFLLLSYSVTSVFNLLRKEGRYGRFAGEGSGSVSGYNWFCIFTLSLATFRLFSLHTRLQSWPRTNLSCYQSLLRPYHERKHWRWFRRVPFPDSSPSLIDFKATSITSPQ